MNELRKITAILLTLVIIFSLGVVALAGEEPAEEDVSAAEDLPPAEESTTEEDLWSVPEEPAAGGEDLPGEEVVVLPEEPVTPEEVEPESEPEEAVPQEESWTEEEPLSETEPEETVSLPEEVQTEQEAPAETEPSEEEALLEEEAEELQQEEAEAAAEPRPWVEPGNTDAEILGGGRSVWVGDTLYFIDGALWMDDGGTALLTYEADGNLNASDGWIYYTVSGEVRRIPCGGGSVETVYSFGGRVKQLYVMGNELRFLADGAVYSYDMETEVLETWETPEYVLGLIPTEYGNIYLTGTVRNYDIWAGMTWLYGGVQQCYTDGSYLVALTGGDTMQAPYYDMFAYGSCDFQPYSLHVDYGNGLSEEQQLQNEAAYFESSEYQLMQDGLNMSVDGIYVQSNPNIVSTGTMNSDQKNIVLRARQMAEVTWTPLMWRYSWGGDNSFYNSYESGAKVVAVSGLETTGYFQGGETYKGIPYSQAVRTGYVGWDISIDEFIQAVNDTSSLFYSGYSTYSRTAPYYGSDCSGFVSYAWDLPQRCTCTTILAYSYRIENNIQNLQIGDVFNEPNSHIALVTNIGYDADGYVNAVEITEQTPSKVRVSCYGETIPGKEYDRTGSLSYIQQYFFNYGYSIYRRNYSGSVSFEPSYAVNLEESGYISAPTISLAVNSAGTAKVVTLTHSNKNAVIYYTTDGSQPTKNSTRYKGSFEVTKDTTVKAIADGGSSYTGSYTLAYTVTVEKAETPVLALVKGALQGQYVSSGTTVTVKNTSKDTVYYTTDGSTPTKKSSKMPDEGIEITSDTTIKAIAVSDSRLNSDVAVLNVKVGRFFTVKVTKSSGGSISPSGSAQVLRGSDAVFTIKPDEFYQVADVLVDGKSVGAVESYTLKDVQADHTIQAKFSVAMPFKDVTTQWFAESVNFVYSKGLFSGTSADKFSPNARMTRGMFITVLGRFISDGQWRDLEKWSGCLGITNGSSIAIREKTNSSDESVVLGLTGAKGQRVTVLSRVPKGIDGGVWYKVSVDGIEGYIRETMPNDSSRLLYVYDGKFEDLANGAYYTGYAEWSYIYGIMNGVSDKQFSPNSYITRQDICVLFYRYLLKYTNKEISAKSSDFADADQVSDYAKSAVYAMKNIGVISGYSDGTLHPRGYATRAEVATMFQRLYEWMYE